MAEHNQLGKEGEEQAVLFLLNKGYRILERNWRCQKAEVDVIAVKADVIIAVEVKARSTTHFGNPQDFVNPKKVRLLVEAMDNYIRSHNLDCSVRFDIIAVVYKNSNFELEHIEDAFLYF